MKRIFLCVLLGMSSFLIMAQFDKVSVQKGPEGSKLKVSGQDFMICSMNRVFIPIGTDVVDARFWIKPDDIIKVGLDTKMSLLKNMNVNVIRLYTGVPARWIKNFMKANSL